MSSIMSKCTSSRCPYISLSCIRAPKYFPLMGCWGLTHCIPSVSQRPQNTMDGNGNHGNTPHNSKKCNLSVWGCLVTCWLSCQEAVPAAPCDNCWSSPTSPVGKPTFLIMPSCSVFSVAMFVAICTSSLPY